MEPQKPSRHAVVAALPIAAVLTLIVASYTPLQFSPRANDLGIVSLTTLRGYPHQQEIYWTLYCCALAGLFAWGLARVFRAASYPASTAFGVEAVSAFALGSALWLPPSLAGFVALLAAATAILIARMATGSSVTADLEPLSVHAGARVGSRRLRATWLAAILLASVFSLQPMFPDGFWSGAGLVARDVDDLRIASDDPYFHGEWGEHLSWADQIRRGELQGRDFFSLYGPLYEYSLVAIQLIFGRSLASFTLWQGLLHLTGLLCAFALGLRLLRFSPLILALPLLLPYLHLRMGLPLLAIALLIRWRQRDDRRYAIAAGFVGGTALVFSQEFGLAFALVAAATFALDARWRPAALAVGGALVAPTLVVLYFASQGALGEMLGDLVRYPGYVAAGYANLPVTPLLDRLPLSLMGSSAVWELKLRLVYGVPAICLGALLLNLPLEHCSIRDLRAGASRVRRALLGDPHRFGVVALALFGLLSFRVALGRSDLPHLQSVIAPAALLVCVGLDRLLCAWRNGSLATSGFAWRATALALLAIQAGLIAGRQPIVNVANAGRAATALLSDRRSHEPSERIAWLNDWLRSHTTGDEAILALPNGASTYYLAERRNPTRFALSGMIITEAHRAEVLQDLMRDPPAAIIWDDRGLRIDGLTDRLVLGEATLNWIEDNYQSAAAHQQFRIQRPSP